MRQHVYKDFRCQYNLQSDVPSSPDPLQEKNIFGPSLFRPIDNLLPFSYFSRNSWEGSKSDLIKPKLLTHVEGLNSPLWEDKPSPCRGYDLTKALNSYNLSYPKLLPQFGLPDKGRAIKGLVVCNNRDLYTLGLQNGLALSIYQPSPEVLIVYKQLPSQRCGEID